MREQLIAAQACANFAPGLPLPIAMLRLVSGARDSLVLEYESRTGQRFAVPNVPENQPLQWVAEHEAAVAAGLNERAEAYARLGGFISKQEVALRRLALRLSLGANAALCVLRRAA